PCNSVSRAAGWFQSLMMESIARISGRTTHSSDVGQDTLATGPRLDLFCVEIGEPRAAESADEGQPKCREPCDNVDGAAQIARLAHDAADRSGHKYQPDQETLREPVDKFPLAGRGDQIGPRGPAARKGRAAGRPPRHGRYELLLAPGCGIAETCVETKPEYGQENVHNEGGKDATGNRCGVMKAAQGVSIHWLP